MQLTGRVSAIIIAAAILLGAGVCLMVMHGPNPGTPFGNLLYPQPGEQFCIPPGGEGKLLTIFWGEVVKKTGVDDSSAVLLDFSLTGYPGKIPRILHFSFSSKKDWWSGSRRVVMMNNDRDNCGCFRIIPSRESPDISGKTVPPPSEIFSELEQVSFSDVGVGGKELFINTALGYDSPTDTSERWILLANGSVLPLHGITFDPRKSLVYPWSIQTMECTGEPDQRECSSRPAAWLFSDKRLGGANVSVGN